MPSMLLVRMAGAIPDAAPRWLLAAASAVCDPAGGTRTDEDRPFSVGQLMPDAGPNATGLGGTGLGGTGLGGTGLGGTGLGTHGDGRLAGTREPSTHAATSRGTSRLVSRREPSERATPAAPAVTTWRLGWLADDAPLPSWPPDTVRFGSRVVPVIGADLHRYSYAELAQGRPARGARLTMNTPTFFSRDGRDLPLPDPALAIGGLLARWNTYAPGPLRIGADDARALIEAVFLDGVWGASSEVELGHGLRQVGFVGQADLRLLAATSDYIATMFAALARFAAFAGVGERTAHGFGTVDIDVVDLAPARRRTAPATVPATRRSDRTPARSPAAGATRRR
ncbi:CRISPR system precrRNA processing endoribonuclease RAMP protein Cas6 [Pseudofrankia asymbiotica]|uniref:CRISPR system precrRNA processing endoribonuclease RAMP protein Cas6 n=1 Tax=Pseudofrankia asymbiotica TaxID=1834516 RepID=UPI0009789112|nr:CRISPR system precrRNA processing endoribonuclease RAMP protein Cas6 [Pseudofrankia asymbiotica]